MTLLDDVADSPFGFMLIMIALALISGAFGI